MIKSYFSFFIIKSLWSISFSGFVARFAIIGMVLIGDLLRRVIRLLSNKFIV